MTNKITLAALGMLATALLYAPVANGASMLTMPVGTLVPNGTLLTVTANNSLHLETALGTVECEEVMLNGIVSKSVEGEFEAKTSPGMVGSLDAMKGCSLEGAVPVAMSELNITRLRSTETGTGDILLAVDMQIEAGGEKITCHFETPAEKAGVFHYEVGSNVIHITPMSMASTECGEGTFSGTMEFETAATSGGGTMFFY